MFIFHYLELLTIMMKHIPTTTQNGIIKCVLMLNGKSSFKIKKKPLEKLI